MDEHRKEEPRATAKRNRHRTAAERAQLIQDFRASGLTQERFAAERQITVATLRAWIYRPASAGASGGLVPVQVVSPRARDCRGAIAVRWPQGMEVELAVDLDGSGVERLLRELLPPCSR